MDLYRPLVAGPSALRDLYTVVIVSHSAVVALNLSPIIVVVVRGAFSKCRADKRASERASEWLVLGLECRVAWRRTGDSRRASLECERRGGGKGAHISHSIGRGRRRDDGDDGRNTIDVSLRCVGRRGKQPSLLSPKSGTSPSVSKGVSRSMPTSGAGEIL